MWDSLPTILPSNKVHCRAFPEPMEPSNRLPLIEARLLLWSPQTKYTLCSTLKSFFTFNVEPPLRPIEPSNSLPLIKARLLLWSPRTKYTRHLNNF